MDCGDRLGSGHLLTCDTVLFWYRMTPDASDSSIGRVTLCTCTKNVLGTQSRETMAVSSCTSLALSVARYMSRNIIKFRTDKFDTKNKRKFGLSNSCKRLGTSRLYKILHTSSNIYEHHSSCNLFMCRITVLCVV